MRKFADIHCHPTLHPFAYSIAKVKRNSSVWDQDRPRKKQRDQTFPEFTQADFTTLFEGNTKLAFISLYPLEQGWVTPDLIGEGDLTDMLVRMLVRVPAKFINTVQSNQFIYFDYLQKEYDYLKSQAASSGSREFEIVRNGNHLMSLSGTDKLAVIITIEGAHSLVSGNAATIEKGYTDMNLVIRNIETLKKWDHPPFFITLSHHFYNGFCGHSRSIPGIAKVLLKQGTGMSEPINANGERVIDCLLNAGEFSATGSRRILIDTKHMSVAARTAYYQRVGQFNRIAGEDSKIPIIASHSGVTGSARMNDSIIPPDTDEDKYKASKEFNPWSINLSGDEIRQINRSSGVIGLNFDQRILTGAANLKQLGKTKDLNKLKNEWAAQFLLQIKAIVLAVMADPDSTTAEKEHVWSCICIGSDFDGMINPVDAFITATDFNGFAGELEAAMAGDPEMVTLLGGRSPATVVDKISYSNALDFAVKFYK